MQNQSNPADYFRHSIENRSNGKWGVFVGVAVVVHALAPFLKVSVYGPEGPSGRSLSRFPWHEATRSISTPPWMGCQSTARLPLALNSPVPVYTPGWREAP